MLFRGQNILGYRPYADDVVEYFVQKSIANGIDIIRIFDCLNDIRNLQTAVTACNKEKGHAQVALSYTLGDAYTLDYWMDMAKRVEDMGADSLCIKDMAGLLVPAKATELVQALKDSTSLPVELHTHYTSGVASMTYMKAVEAGVDIIDTAMSPFALGTSQPATEVMVEAFKGTEFDTGLDLNLLSEIADYFRPMREEALASGLMNPKVLGVNINTLRYQVPGGMLSNLISQLKEQNALDRYNDVLDEMPRVRKDMGYPPLVTPTSQIVGIQAVMNVLGGERYKTVSNEVKEYMKGFYGKPPAPVNAKIANKIIGDEEVITCRPADLLEDEFDKYKTEGEQKGFVKSDEDALTYALYPSIAPKFLKGEAVEEELKSVALPSDNEIGIPTQYNVEVDGDVYEVKIMPTGFMEVEETEKGPFTPVEGGLISTMQGMVIKLTVNVGDKVTKGSTVAVIEAMKMENDIQAEEDGVVKEIFVEDGDAVNSGDILMVIE